MMPAAKYLNLVRLRDIACESHAAGAQDASFLVELDERAEVECLEPACFLAKRKAAVMSGLAHVVVLEPAFAGLVAHRAVDGMVQEQELHRIPDRSMDAFGIGPDF